MYETMGVPCLIKNIRILNSKITVYKWAINSVTRAVKTDLIKLDFYTGEHLCKMLQAYPSTTNFQQNINEIVIFKETVKANDMFMMQFSMYIYFHGHLGEKSVYEGL